RARARGAPPRRTRSSSTWGVVLPAARAASAISTRMARVLIASVHQSCVRAHFSRTMRGMGTSDGGMRERKKLATRRALSAAALRLAREHGPQNVRVDDIAEAAGVSPRTYNNYFSSREQ